ncbi:MAG: chemotaxis protein CheB [Candidatus Wallbacteria bacterium]|nr:chemotaxis protein CheB [Candidatus Wallbacteria bacterium]
MIRLAVVDDSAMVREFLSTVFADEADIELIAIGTNGAEAIDIVHKHKLDVLVLDLEMPGIGGIDVLKAIMRDRPLKVLVYTTHGEKSLAAFQALRLGALEFLNKPDNLLDEHKFESAKTKLLERVRAVASATLQVSALDPTVAPRVPRLGDCPFTAMAVAATSGGTAPLLPMIRALPSSMPIPVLLFPHLNAAMTTGFAEWLNSEVSVRVAVLADKTRITPGTVYVATTGRGYEIRDGQWTVVAENAADPGAGGLDASLSHVATVYGTKLLAVLLGGIGVDGLEGLGAVRKAGGQVLVLDPGTAYTPDLPAAAVRQGLASEVVPVARLGQRVLELCNIRRS